MTALAPTEAYRLWAPLYREETAISYLDDRLVSALSPPAAGVRLLDAGCGTARRLGGAGAAIAVGVDLSIEMLAAASDRSHPLVAGDLRRLPIASGSFDLVWCRLVIGHVAEIGAAYGELARVCRPGGTVVVTDFHPAAVAAGHRRTFRDAGGEVREVEHHVHSSESHAAWAALAGLRLRATREGRVGPEIRAFYRAAHREDSYRAHLGLPLVLALEFQRDAAR
jgi:malonyl-CoA O-methyltransferase